MAEEPEAVVSSEEGQADTGNLEAESDQAESQSGETQADPFSKVDPSTLPPELQEIYKSMQADYTRKTQEVSGKFKDYESLAQRAEAFDRMMSNPKFASLLSGEEQQPQAGREASPSIFDVPADVLDKYIKETPGGIIEVMKAVMEEERQKIESEFSERYEPVASQVYMDKANAVIQEMRGKYPDFEQHEEAISQALQENEKLSLEQAYRLVTWDKSYQKGVDKGAETVKKRSATGQADGANASVTKNNPRPKSVQEAARQALEAAGLA